MTTRGRQLRAAVRVAKAIGDGPRARILMLLAGGELCVCQIVEVLGLAPSTVSKHLSLLEQADLITARKAGRWMYYRWTDGRSGDFAQPVRTWLTQTLQRDPDVLKDRKTLKHVTACAPAVLRERQRRAT